jgi:tRNA A-37 threonylcarbamoyl transferase component Bud32
MIPARLIDRLLEWEDLTDQGKTVTGAELCPDSPNDATLLDEYIQRLRRVKRIVEFKQAPSQKEPPEKFPIPFGRYELREPIGEGASAKVYRAWDYKFGIEVALKRLRPDKYLIGLDDRTELGRFRSNEANALARLTQENVIRVYDTGEYDGVPYVATELVDGKTLKHRLQEFHEAGPAVWAPVMQKVCLAVGYAHSKGVCHRDLKPGNILLTKDNRPLVGDFGLAIEIASNRGNDDPYREPGPEEPNAPVADPLTSLQPGTPAYMAPERFTDGVANEASDVWSLGVILYELLAGKRPFQGVEREQLRTAICGGAPPRPTTIKPRVNRRLEEVILKCLEAQPSARYPSAAAVAEALGRAIARRRRKVLWAAVAVVAIGVLLGRSASVGYWPFAKPQWPDVPAVKTALADLTDGKTIVLIDQDKPPSAYDWARGTGSGTMGMRDDGILTIKSVSPGGCLLELLPGLPPGKYRIDAELRQEVGDAMCWVGIYAAATHWQIPEGRQHFFVLARYSDFGLAATAGPEANAETASRRTHLAIQYMRNSNQYPYEGHTDTVAFPAGKTIQAPAVGWRRISLTIDSGAVRATQGNDEAVVGELDVAGIQARHAKTMRLLPKRGNMTSPLRMEGGNRVVRLQYGIIGSPVYGHSDSFG